MNLRMADPSGLVAFLHRMVSETGEPVLTVEGSEVVEVTEGLFYVGSDPVTVGGPFESLAALLLSEGRLCRVEYKDALRSEPLWRVIEWRGAFFRIEEGSTSDPQRYAELKAALAGSI